MKNLYYVYVYIDPRNYEEFYYGKGQGSRKIDHLYDLSDSVKAKRIRAIKKDHLEPIIRVIATGLTEKEALLIEKTLLWKLGKFLTNKSSGHFSDKFRPHDTLHVELNGFDYQNGLYFYNVGEGENRNWDDYREYSFISAGQGESWRDAILGLNHGDIVAAYLKGFGFVGIGRIKKRAKMIQDVLINKKRLIDYDLKCKNMTDNLDDPNLSEYVAIVEWIIAIPREDAKWKSKFGLYTPQHIKASLDKQPKTVEFLEDQFKINLLELIT